MEDPGSSASAYGSAFHLALEDFHGEYPRPSNDDEAAMRRRIRECVTWAFERNRNGFETQVEFELQVRRAQRTAQRYVDWLLVQAKNAPFEVIGREVAAEISLHDRPFIGYIDRLDRDERTGGIRVVDYKTGSIATSPAEYAEKVRAYADFQLPFYYWARTAAGDRVTHLVLISAARRTAGRSARRSGRRLQYFGCGSRAQPQRNGGARRSAGLGNDPAL